MSLAPAARACHPERLDEQPALQHEELGLGLEAAVAAVAAELAAAGEHAVARDDDRQRVAAASAADLLGHAAGVMGDLAVAAGLAIGDALHGGPDLLLEAGAFGPQRQIEIAPLAREIGAELPRGFLEERGRRLLPRLAPMHGDQRAVLLLDAQRHDWAVL